MVVLLAWPMTQRRPTTTAMPIHHLPADEPELGCCGGLLGCGGGVGCGDGRLVPGAGPVELVVFFGTGGGVVSTSDTSEERPANPLPSPFFLSFSPPATTVSP